MQAKIVIAVLKFAIGYLVKHPQVLEKVTQRIPGKLDDEALDVVLKLLKEV